MGKKLILMLQSALLLIYNISMPEEENRKLCARLIQEVLSGYRITREALKRFPKGDADKSVIAAYHALIHYEADEDIRKRDKEYKMEQDLYLKSIAEILATGSQLPENIINSYEEFYEGTVLTEKNTFIDKFKSIFRFISL